MYTRPGRENYRSNSKKDRSPLRRSFQIGMTFEDADEAENLRTGGGANSKAPSEIDTESLMHNKNRLGVYVKDRASIADCDSNLASPRNLLSGDKA